MNAIQENIQASVHGNVSGQIAIGSYILQIGDINGSVVNIIQTSARPAIQQRARPVSLKPRPFPSILDRESETSTIRTALGEFSPVSLFGSGGVGKTTLLRRIAYLPETKRFPDGVVYLPVKDQGLEDLLQMLFDSFYSSSADEKPTEVKVRHDVQGIEALILLDDLTLDRDDVESLLNLMPASVFVLASTKRALWGDGRVIALPGLPNPMIVSLFERELDRSLSEDEAATVKQIGSFLGEHPMRILYAAALVRESGVSISGLWDQLRDKDPNVAIVQVSLSSLNSLQKRILEILAAAGGSVMPLQHLAALAEMNNIQAVLDSLKSLGFIQAHSPRYSLTAVMENSLASQLDLSSWGERLIEHFSGWVAQGPAMELLDEASNVLLFVMKKAGDKARWRDVARMGRQLERLMIIKKRWQAWADILDLTLKAAQALGDRELEAWVLHQLGSRALCLELKDKPRDLLTKALKIRKAIGDKPGAAVTQHNLNILNGIPTPPKTKIKKAGGSSRFWGLFGVLVLLAVIIGYSLVSAGPLIPVSGASHTPVMPYEPTRVTKAAPVTIDPATQARIILATITRTPSPTRTSTRTLTPTRTPTSIPCYLARFVQDVTVPDGTTVNSGTSFIKTWRLKNEGSCAWNSSYQIIFVDGDSMSAPGSSSWSGGVVQYGGTIDISVKLLAPSTSGTHQGYFKLRAPDGTVFGVGVESKPFWVKIVVPNVDGTPPYPPEIIYPENSSKIDCKNQYLTLAWSEAYDESGIAEYEVWLEYSPYGGAWKPVGTWSDRTKMTKTQIQVSCNYSYRWYVRARDFANNWSEYSEAGYFEVVDIPD